MHKKVKLKLMRDQFDRYVSYKDSAVVKVFFAPNDSQPVESEEYIKISKSLKVEVGDSISIEDGRAIITPPKEDKKPWWKIG